MRRILIIDDAANLRLLYQLEFELEGYEAVAVGSGKEALEILAHENIDAVILDFLLPNSGGCNCLMICWHGNDICPSLSILDTRNCAKTSVAGALMLLWSSLLI